MLYSPSVFRPASAVFVLPPYAAKPNPGGEDVKVAVFGATESSKEFSLDVFPARITLRLPKAEEQQRPGGRGTAGEQNACPEGSRHASSGVGQGPLPPVQSPPERKTIRPTSERSDIWGVWGAWPTSGRRVESHLDVRHEPALFPCGRSACCRPVQHPFYACVAGGD